MTDIDRLADAIEQQAKAIHSLVESNALILQAIVEAAEVDEEQSPLNYLDGAPVGKDQDPL